MWSVDLGETHNRKRNSGEGREARSRDAGRVRAEVRCGCDCIKEKTGGSAARCRVHSVEILFRRDLDGEDQEWENAGEAEIVRTTSRLFTHDYWWNTFCFDFLTCAATPNTMTRRRQKIKTHHFIMIMLFDMSNYKCMM